MKLKRFLYTALAYAALALPISADALQDFQKTLKPDSIEVRSKQRTLSRKKALEELAKEKEGLKKAASLCGPQLITNLGHNRYLVRLNSQKLLEDLIVREDALGRGIKDQICIASESKDLEVRIRARGILWLENQLSGMDKDYRKMLVSIAKPGELRKYLTTYNRIRRVFDHDFWNFEESYEDPNKFFFDAEFLYPLIKKTIIERGITRSFQYVHRLPIPTKKTPKMYAFYAKTMVDVIKDEPYWMNFLSGTAFKRLVQMDSESMVDGYIAIVNNYQMNDYTKRDHIEKAESIVERGYKFRLLSKLEKLREKESNKYQKTYLTSILRKVAQMEHVPRRIIHHPK